MDGMLKTVDVTSPEMNSVFSVINTIHKAQVDIENRIKESHLRSVAEIGISLEAQMIKLQNQLAAIDTKYEISLSKVNESITDIAKKMSCNREAGTAISHHHIERTTANKSADSIKTDTSRHTLLNNSSVSDSKLALRSNDDAILTESVPSESKSIEAPADLAYLTHMDKERQRRVAVISNVVNNMNLGERRGSTYEETSGEVDDADDWTLDTGFDKSNQSLWKWSGFIHYFFGISGPNLLVGHKGSRIIHPKSPFVSGDLWVFRFLKE